MLKIKTKISKLPLVVLIIFLIALFYGLSIKPSGRLPWHQHLLFVFLEPVQKSINFLGGGIKGIWNHYFYLVDVSRENEKLRKLVEEQSFKIRVLDEAKSENDRIRALMDFKEKYDFNTVGADVVASDPRGDFRAITIDKGSKDGVRALMPVVASAGIVGRIADVSGRMAKVLLITDPNSAVDVVVARSRSRALLVGTQVKTKLDFSYYTSKLEYLDRKSDVIKGDIVVTSGFDGVYAPGIPVGEISELDPAPPGVFREAVVTPFVDFSNLEEVLVIVR